MALTEEIEERLRMLGVSYRLLEHEPVTTSAAAAAVRGVSLASGAKALLVKANDHFAIFVLSAARQLNWKDVKRILGVKSARFATEEELNAKTGLTKGSVPPFGNLLGIPVFVDQSITDEDLVRFNAGSLVKSIEMPGAELLDAVAGELASFSKGGGD